MYAKLTALTDATRKSKVLKHYHHITLDREFLDDCRMWKTFLQHAYVRVLCRPFADFDGDISGDILPFLQMRLSIRLRAVLAVISITGGLSAAGK